MGPVTVVNNTDISLTGYNIFCYRNILFYGYKTTSWTELNAQTVTHSFIDCWCCLNAHCNVEQKKKVVKGQKFCYQ